ncbi:hypothetical protein BpHYR1_033460 [Brachionus plicatilis]|uniref:Uncharacterized protein n=1 Tax=Brachionus plicatilis TaxID=10195 RepID=A0A3M7STX0_BRAPC|nr:hypothetical protein BpHYR1_033460 [Brachionus plicatilis]
MRERERERKENFLIFFIYPKFGEIEQNCRGLQACCCIICYFVIMCIEMEICSRIKYLDAGVVNFEYKLNKNSSFFD